MFLQLTLPCFGMTDCVGVIKGLEWARANGDGERLSFSGLHHEIILSPLENSARDNSRTGKELQIVGANTIDVMLVHIWLVVVGTGSSLLQKWIFIMRKGSGIVSLC